MCDRPCLADAIGQDWRRVREGKVGMTVSRAPEASRVMRSDCAQSTTANTECAAANTSVLPAVRCMVAVARGKTNIVFFLNARVGREAGSGAGGLERRGCLWAGLRAGRAWRGGVARRRRWRGVAVVLLVFSLCPFSSVVVCLAPGLLRLAFVLGVFLVGFRPPGSFSGF